MTPATATNRRWCRRLGPSRGPQWSWPRPRDARARAPISAAAAWPVPSQIRSTRSSSKKPLGDEAKGVRRALRRSGRHDRRDVQRPPTRAASPSRTRHRCASTSAPASTHPGDVEREQQAQRGVGRGVDDVFPGTSMISGPSPAPALERPGRPSPRAVATSPRASRVANPPRSSVDQARSNASQLPAPPITASGADLERRSSRSSDRRTYQICVNQGSEVELDAEPDQTRPGAAKKAGPHRRQRRPSRSVYAGNVARGSRGPLLADDPPAVASRHPRSRRYPGVRGPASASVAAWACATSPRSAGTIKTLDLLPQYIIAARCCSTRHVPDPGRS